jgi:hypothetical protein
MGEGDASIVSMTVALTLPLPLTRTPDVEIDTETAVSVKYTDIDADADTGLYADTETAAATVQFNNGLVSRAPGGEMFPLAPLVPCCTPTLLEKLQKSGGVDGGAVSEGCERGVERFVAHWCHM